MGLQVTSKLTELIAIVGVLGAIGYLIYKTPDIKKWGEDVKKKAIATGEAVVEKTKEAAITTGKASAAAINYPAYTGASLGVGTNIKLAQIAADMGLPEGAELTLKDNLRILVETGMMTLDAVLSIFGQDALIVTYQERRTMLREAFPWAK